MIWLTLAALSHAQTNSIAFSRIIHGWTNYSTAFTTTHDAQDGGEYATVATFYTPPYDVRPREFAAIVIWYGAVGQRLDWGNFQFHVAVWGSLQTFIGNPRQGDVAHVPLERPTSIVPDAITRGGRTAYEARFDISAANLLLTNCQTYLIGLIAKARQSQAGEVYVPTAPFAGRSDVAAGNIVPFGWTYLVNEGGTTIYSGQLAMELTGELWGTLPQLEITRSKEQIHVAWPTAARCFQLEATDDVGSEWVRVTEARDGHFTTSAEGPSRFFRLRQITE